MDLELTGKIALVTGSSRGIGLATAKAFATEGCQVMLSGRSTEQLREAETALRATGAQVAAHAGDDGERTGTDAKAACARKGNHRPPCPGRLQAEAG